MASVTEGGPTSKRRRFQGPITNYFPASDSQTENRLAVARHYTDTAPTTSLNPTVPNKVQSSLLSVGMRVRKAVPEGYKTTETSTKLGHHVYGNTSSNSTQSAAELMPLCGMFKVGNLAVQTIPRPAVDNEGDLGGTATWEEASISSSQESIDSASSFPAPNSYKRGPPADFDEDTEDIWLSRAVDDIYSPQNRYATRAILTPKLRQQSKPMASRRAKWKGPSCGGAGAGWGQENRAPLPPPIEDFEDAAFLRRREEVDDDFNNMMTEVEMDGV